MTYSRQHKQLKLLQHLLCCEMVTLVFVGVSRHFTNFFAQLLVGKKFAERLDTPAFTYSYRTACFSHVLSNCVKELVGCPGHPSPSGHPRTCSSLSNLVLGASLSPHIAVSQKTGTQSCDNWRCVRLAERSSTSRYVGH